MVQKNGTPEWVENVPDPEYLQFLELGSARKAMYVAAIDGPFPNKQLARGWLASIGKFAQLAWRESPRVFDSINNRTGYYELAEWCEKCAHLISNFVPASANGGVEINHDIDKNRTIKTRHYQYR